MLVSWVPLVSRVALDTLGALKRRNERSFTIMKKISATARQVALQSYLGGSMTLREIARMIGATYGGLHSLGP